MTSPSIWHRARCSDSSGSPVAENRRPRGAYSGSIEPTSGEIVYKGEDLVAKSHKEMRELRKELQMVFQDPYSSLHPRRRIRQTIAEPMIVQGVHQKEALARVPELMRTVQLDPRRVDAYPHEFSGGQRQRIGIARALSVDPEVLVLDEPLSALDVSVQADIINLLQRLQQEYRLAFVFISHNLSVVRYLADEVGVMYLGQIVEIGERRGGAGPAPRTPTRRRCCQPRPCLTLRPSGASSRSSWAARCRAHSTRRAAAVSTRAAGSRRTSAG